MNYKPTSLTYILASAMLLLLLPVAHSLQPVIASICLVPLLLFYKAGKSANQLSDIVFKTWLLGLLYSASTSSWLLQANTQAWTQLGGSIIFVVKILTWLLMSLFLSAGFLILGLICRVLLKKLSWTGFLVLFPFIFIACELLRGLLFSVLALGPGASIGLYWNIGAFGYYLSNTTGLRLAAIGGIFGLGLTLIFLNVLFCLIITSRKWLINGVVFCAITLVLGSSLFLKPHVDSRLQVSALQLRGSGVSAYEDVDNFQNLDGTNQSRQDSQLLVLPEYAQFFYPVIDQSARKSVLAKSSASTDVIFSEKAIQDGKTYNQLKLADDRGVVRQSQDKYFLIPTGEYIPWVLQAFLIAGNKQQVIKQFNETSQISKAVKPEKPLKSKSILIGALACSGIMANERYRQLTDQGAQILVNSASLSEFAGSSLFRSQADQSARFLVAANQRSFIQSTKGGSNALIINNDGIVVARGEDGRSQVIEGQVAISSSKTLYSRIGEWVGWFSLVITILALAYSFKISSFKKNI